MRVKPDGSIITRSAVTDSSGQYSGSFSSSLEGAWTIDASWSGDDTHLGAKGETVNLTVTQLPGILDRIPGYQPIIILLGIILSVIVIGFL